MDTSISSTWWDSYRKTVKTTKKFRELVNLVDNNEDIAHNMVNLAKQKYPDHEEIWYFNKLIAQLKS
ncbi:MAG: hypothetical protein AAGE96_18355, partial [Cyanobacteria bacterium P01_G01_bin.19]